MDTQIGLKAAYPTSGRSYRPRWGKALLYLAIYGLTFILVSLLWQRPVALTLAYALLSSILLWRWHSRSEVVYFALAAVLGPLAEFVAISFGAWEYSRPSFVIPIWLPLAYGISGLLLKKLADALVHASVRPERHAEVAGRRPYLEGENAE